MRYPHLMAAFAAEIWAIQPEKLLAIMDLLAFQAEGGKFAPAEIQARIAGATASAVARKEGAVSLIPLRGLISARAPMVTESSTGGGVNAETFTNQVKAAAADPAVKAIVLDIDSPGGSANLIEEAAQAVFDARSSKPIVAQVCSTAASGAYWIGSSASEMVVTPSGSVGSIGVYRGHEDRSDALAQEGVKHTLISAGRYKTEGNPFGPLADEGLAYHQSQVEKVYGRFVDDVARGRGVSVSTVRDGFGQGRMVLAHAAVAQGMADRVATLDETLSRFGVMPATPAAGRRALAPNREMRALALAELTRA